MTNVAVLPVMLLLRLYVGFIVRGRTRGLVAKFAELSLVDFMLHAERWREVCT